MLITCTSCNTKIRTPESAAGKRVKCPKCATVLDVPKRDEPPETGVSADALPPIAAVPPPPSVPTKPPPWVSKKDDADDEDDDRRRPPKKNRARDRDDDDGDYDRYGEPRRSTPTNETSVSAIVSMVLGIISLVIFPGGCACGVFTFGIGFILGCGVSSICGVLGLILGFMGNKPGSEGFAWTGIICSGIVLALIAMFSCLVMFGIGAGATEKMLNGR